MKGGEEERKNKNKGGRGEEGCPGKEEMREKLLIFKNMKQLFQNFNG